MTAELAPKVDLFGHEGLGRINVTVHGQAQLARGLATSWNYFSALRVAPQLGRTFVPEDETAATPALRRKRSALRCDAEPTPGEAKFNAPGLALAAATRSRGVLMPRPDRTTRTNGVTPSGATAAKSRAGSYPRFGCSDGAMACAAELTRRV